MQADGDHCQNGITVMLALSNGGAWGYLGTPCASISARVCWLQTGRRRIVQGFPGSVPADQFAGKGAVLASAACGRAAWFEEWEADVVPSAAAVQAKAVTAAAGQLP